MLPQVASNLDSATGTRIYIFFFLLLLVFSSFLVVLFAWNFNIYFYFCQGSGFLVWHIGLLFICGIVKSVKGFSFQFSTLLLFLYFTGEVVFCGCFYMKLELHL